MKQREDNPHELRLEYDPPPTVTCPGCGEPVVMLYHATGRGEDEAEDIIINPEESADGTVIIIPISGEMDRAIVLSDDAAPALSWTEKYALHVCEGETE